MTHRQFIKANFEVLAETKTAILFVAYGEMNAEINGVPFSCNSVKEFWETVEIIGNDNLAE